MRYILCSLTSVFFFLSFFLSFFLFILVWSLLLVRCSCRVLLLHLIVFNDSNKRNWQDSPGRRLCPSETPLTVQHATAQKASIYASGGIHNRNPTRRATVDLRLRPCGHWEQPSQKSQFETYHLQNTSHSPKPITSRTQVTVRNLSPPEHKSQSETYHLPNTSQ
jgi:hypothetical protein